MRFSSFVGCRDDEKMKISWCVRTKDDHHSLILPTRQLLHRFENRIGPTAVAWCERVRHSSHQPTDHRPITVQNFHDALLTQIGDPLSVKMAKVDRLWRRAARQNSVFDGLWRYYYRTFKIKSLSTLICR